MLVNGSGRQMARIPQSAAQGAVRRNESVKRVRSRLLEVAGLQVNVLSREVIDQQRPENKSSRPECVRQLLIKINNQIVPVRTGFGVALQFPEAAEDPGSNGVPRLLQAVCPHDMGDLPQGRHVFACPCRCCCGGSGGVGGERSFDVGPAT